MRKTTALLIAILGGFALRAAEPNPMLYQRVSNGKTPVIDGKISANEWNDAAMLPPFARVKGGSPLWDKLNQIMLKFDEKNLYIGFRTYMAIDMALAPAIPDSETMTNVESFDIRFVLPDQPKWKRFMVERGGAKFDQLFRGHKMDRPAEWNPQWEYKCRLIPQQYSSWSIWEGEIAIPWETLGIEHPQKGIKISALFIRYLGNVAVGVDEEGRIVSWAPVSNKTDLIFDANYGGLMLEPGKPVFRMDSLQNYSRSVVGVKGRIVGQNAVGGKLNSAIWDTHNFKRMFDYTDQKVASNNVDWQKSIRVKQAEPGNGRIFIFDAANEPLCKYPFRTTILPSFYAQAVWNSADDQVHFAGQSFNGFRKGDVIRLVVTAPDGRKYAAQELRTGGLLASFDGTVSCASVPDGGEFVASAALMRSGNEVAKSQYKFTKKLPAWKGAMEKFKVTAPPLGWVPLKVTEGADRIELTVRDHAYVFGKSLFPEKVLLHGEEFSAGAWNFIAETEGGLQKFTGDAPKVTARDGRGVTLRYSGASSELKLDAEIRVEFDGLAWYRCRFTPRGKPVTVKRLAIDCPISPEKLRYMRSFYYQIGATTQRYALIGKAKRQEELPPTAVSYSGDISGTGWKYGSSFNYFYWIGGEDRGCLFALPSRRNMSIDKVYNRVIDQPDQFNFTLELVNKSVIWKRPTEYEFGIALTPAHKAVNPAGVRRLGQYPLGIINGQEHSRLLEIPASVYTNDKHISWRFPKPPEGFQIAPDFFFADMVGSWVMRDVMDGNFRPKQKDVDEIRRQCAGIRSGHHGKPMLWYDMLVTPTAKDLEPFFQEWCAAPRTDMPADVFVTVLCPASGWKEAYLYGMKQRMEDGVCSFYSDMSALRPCTNRLHGCGYYDEKGALKPTLPFLQYREFMLMVQKGIKENDPDGVFFYHGVSPMNLWCDAHQECEYWQFAPDYLTMSPEFLQMEMFDKRQSGSQPYLTNALCYRHVPGALRTKMPQMDPLGLFLLHDQHCYNTHALEIYGNYITTKPLLDFGVDDPDCEYIPYWRNPLSQYPGKGNIAVSSYRKGDRELAVIFNLASEAAEIDLGDKSGVSRLGEAETLSGVIEVGPRSLRIVEFGSK